MSSFHSSRVGPISVMFRILGWVSLWSLISRDSGPGVTAQMSTPETFIGLDQDIDGEEIHVWTQSGWLEGRRRPGVVKAGGITSTVDWYLGVPYALPPVSQRRFQAPEEVYRWEDVRSARRFGAACPQVPYHQQQFISMGHQDENCLYLNIYTPFEEGADENVTYPVYVYMHGGSYRHGAGSVYPGQVLAQYGVVVITINYRLGLLGFLCDRGETFSGNYGLLDQVQALKWVQRNIRGFRGDPDKVTIAGNSAGGTSVGLLSVSPVAKGLFHQAVAQSGSMLSFWAMHNQTVDLRAHTLEVTSLLGCTGKEDLVQCMRGVEWQIIPDIYQMGRRISMTGDEFVPCKDGYVIPHMPEDVPAGRAHVSRVMTGVVGDEWARNVGWMVSDYKEGLLDGDLSLGIDRASFEKAVSHVLVDKFGYDEIIAKAVLHQYTNWEAPYDPIANRDAYIQFMSDMSFVAPAVDQADFYFYNHIPVYMYKFCHFSELADPLWWRSYHTLELEFIFGSPFLDFMIDGGYPHNYTDEDRRISKKMMRLWSNFIKHGQPQVEDREGHKRGPSWEAFHPDTTNYFKMETERFSMQRFLHASEVAFWRHYVPYLRSRSEWPHKHVDQRRLVWGLVTTVGVLMVALIAAAFLRVKRTCPTNRPGTAEHQSIKI